MSKASNDKIGLLAVVATGVGGNCRDGMTIEGSYRLANAFSTLAEKGG